MSDKKAAKTPQIDVPQLTDFEVSMLVIERDVAQFKMNAIDELLNKVGEVKGYTEAQQKTTGFVQEETFTTLKFEQAKGERLGEFEVSHRSSNLSDKWAHAYAVLRQNNSTIKDRYHGPNYKFSYWLYGEDRIYRQKRKP
jgi:hypothetical protein